MSKRYIKAFNDVSHELKLGENEHRYDILVFKRSLIFLEESFLTDLGHPPESLPHI